MTDPLILSPVEGPLQIPPLPGAVPRTGGEAGHPAGVSPLLPSPGNLSAIPSGRTTGAAAHPETAAHPEPVEGCSAAITTILAERHRQIHHFGHTPASDAKLPCSQLPRAAQRFLTAALEDCQFHRTDWRAHARRHLAQAGAMILAAIDRIENEPEEDIEL